MWKYGILVFQSVFLRIPLSPFRNESGGKREGVKNDQKIKVLRMGWPIVENVPTSCGSIFSLFTSPQFNPRKKTKKSIHALTLSQAINDLMDDRFTGLAHFYAAVAEDRPRKEKNLAENIERYAPEGDFTEEEKLEYLVNLTGVFPINAVVTPRVRQKLEELYVPPISEFDPSLGVTWFIPRECKLKKSKNGKNFYVVKVICPSICVVTYFYFLGYIYNFFILYFDI